MKYLIIILTTCALCMGCKKNRTVIVKGKVLNPITNEGFADQTVYLQYMSSGSLGTTGSFQNATSVQTDANGFFEIEYTGNKNYNLMCDILDHYRVGWYLNNEQATSFSTMSVPKGEETYAEYHSVPYKTINMVINHNSCEGVTDTTYFQTKRTIIDENFSSLSSPQVGCLNSNSNPEFLAGTWIYKFTLIRPSGTEIKYDTFYVDPDVTNQVINLDF